MRVFLSYRHHNIKRIKPIADQLISAGFEIWIDYQETPTFDFISISQAIFDCEILLAVVSLEDTIGDSCRWIRSEMLYARLLGKTIFTLSLESLQDIRDIPPPWKDHPVLDIADNTWVEHLVSTPIHHNQARRPVHLNYVLITETESTLQYLTECAYAGASQYIKSDEISVFSANNLADGMKTLSNLELSLEPTIVISGYRFRNDESSLLIRLFNIQSGLFLGTAPFFIFTHTDFEYLRNHRDIRRAMRKRPHFYYFNPTDRDAKFVGTLKHVSLKCVNAQSTIDPDLLIFYGIIGESPK